MLAGVGRNKAAADDTPRPALFYLYLKGAILTTTSVVFGAERIWIRTTNGLEVEARLAGMDPKSVQDPFSPVVAELRDTSKKLNPPVPPFRSVARARGKADMGAAEQALAPLFGKIKDGAVPKPDDKGAVPGEIKAAIAEARGKVAEKEPFDAVAVALFDFALAGLENPTHDQMKAVVDRAGTSLWAWHQAEPNSLPPVPLP